MLKSMTGFGRGEVLLPGKRITVEIRSVNHRYCEVVIRMPRTYSALEEKIRRAIQSRVARGRLEVLVNVVQEEGQETLVKVDKELGLAYYNSLRELGNFLQISAEISAEQLSRLPGVLVLQEEEVDLVEFWGGLETALDEAMQSLIGMRESEGMRLERDLIHRIDRIAQFINDLSMQEPLVVTSYRDRLAQRIKEMISESLVEESRLATEVAIFAERSSITEELVRINSHLLQFQRIIKAAEPVGRKLDFLIQELHREINTIGSKANDTVISHLVVEVKGELEKIREQLQNVE